MVIVEWAYADVFIDAVLFERQELLNDQRDIRLVFEFLDDFVGVEWHAPNVEIFWGWGRHRVPMGSLRFGFRSRLLIWKFSYYIAIYSFCLLSFCLNEFNLYLKNVFLAIGQ